VGMVSLKRISRFTKSSLFGLRFGFRNATTPAFLFIYLNYATRVLPLGGWVTMKPVSSASCCNRHLGVEKTTRYLGNLFPSFFLFFFEILFDFS